MRAQLDQIHQQIARLNVKNPYKISAKQARRIVKILGMDRRIRPVVDATLQARSVRAIRSGRNANRRMSAVFAGAGVGSVVGGVVLHLQGGTPHGIAMAGSGLGATTAFSLYHRDIAKSADRALDTFYIKAASDALSYVREKKISPQVSWWRRGQLKRLDRELKTLISRQAP
jgi:hypothetical protein